MDESTPRPWKRDASAEVFGVMIRDGSDRWLVTANGDHDTGDGPHPQFPSNAEMEANARLIVRAVNAHEKLIRAARLALGTIGNECFCADSGAGDLRVCRHCVTRSELRSALALAEQE